MTLFTTGFLQSVTAVQKQLFKNPIQKLLKKLETTHIGYFLQTISTKQDSQIFDLRESFTTDSSRYRTT